MCICVCRLTIYMCVCILCVCVRRSMSRCRGWRWASGLVGRVGRPTNLQVCRPCVYTYIYNSEKSGTWRLVERASEPKRPNARGTYITVLYVHLLLQTCRISHPLLRTYAGTGQGVHGGSCTGWQGETSMFILKFYFIFCNCLIKRQGPNLSTA